MRIAIVQDIVTLGGRFSVLSEIILQLNKTGIVPDIITRKITFSKQDVLTHFKINLKYEIKLVQTLGTHKLPETTSLLFVLQVRKKLKKYDLIINSNNTLYFFPQEIKTISYIHFPRKSRVRSKRNIHSWPEERELVKFKTQIANTIDRLIVSTAYLIGKVSTQNIIANSEFTKEAIIKSYKLNQKLVKVIYPPVKFHKQKNGRPKKDYILSLGRFSKTKNQLLQLKIAKTLPKYKFIIAGFCPEKDKYLALCEKFILENKVKNVIIKTNLSYNKLDELLHSAKYFLHSTWNEPFGITTVQSIAAGCIPIVPDSGGQKEIVPEKSLRYYKISDVNEILQHSYDSKYDMAKILMEEIKKYSREEFQKNFNNLLSKLI